MPFDPNGPDSLVQIVQHLKQSMGIDQNKELPNESGQFDPRLSLYHPVEAAKAAKKTLYDNPMSTLDNVISGLKKAK